MASPGAAETSMPAKSEAYGHGRIGLFPAQACDALTHVARYAQSLIAERRLQFQKLPRQVYDPPNAWALPISGSTFGSSARCDRLKL